MHKRVSRLVLLAIVIASFASVGVAIVAQRPIMDWLALRNYQPSKAVQALASETNMDDYARKVFYVNHPQIQNKSSFNTSCSNNNEQTIVLGCYHPGQNGIYVLKVTDARLNGVEQVTAAHEMLHGAYERLSKKDKTYVDGLLMDYYRHDLHDQRIIDTMNAYKKSEPDQLVNEMHSIFGTEINDLPAPLENYYKRYFTDRKKIAAYAAQYQGAFTSRQAQVKRYDTQLAVLKIQITTNEKSLETQAAAIGTERARLDSEKSSGNVDAYNAGVPGFNASIDAYNALASETRSLIVQYNQIVEKRNAIAVEENQLAQAINSKVTTIK